MVSIGIMNGQAYTYHHDEGADDENSEFILFHAIHILKSTLKGVHSGKFT